MMYIMIAKMPATGNVLSSRIAPESVGYIDLGRLMISSPRGVTKASMMNAITPANILSNNVTTINNNRDKSGRQ